MMNVYARDIDGAHYTAAINRSMETGEGPARRIADEGHARASGPSPEIDGCRNFVVR